MYDPNWLDAADEVALDALPFGVIRLDATGRIERYNQAEATRAGIQRWRAIGRDFYRDVASERDSALAAAIAAIAPGMDAHLHHTFRRYGGTRPLTIHVTRTASGGAYLCFHPA